MYREHQRNHPLVQLQQERGADPVDRAQSLASLVNIDRWRFRKRSASASVALSSLAPWRGAARCGFGAGASRPGPSAFPGRNFPRTTPRAAPALPGCSADASRPGGRLVVFLRAFMKAPSDRKSQHTIGSCSALFSPYHITPARARGSRGSQRPASTAAMKSSTERLKRSGASRFTAWPQRG